MNKSKSIKTHISKCYKDKLIQKASEKGISTSDYIIELINKNLCKIPPHKLEYLIREHTTLGVRIDDDLYNKLICKVHFENMNISEYLRELIYKDIRDGE